MTFFYVCAVYIQVYLEGATTSGTNEHVYVKIATSGVFNDTFNGKDYNFVSVPLNLAFEYVPDTKHVTIGGNMKSVYNIKEENINKE